LARDKESSKQTGGRRWGGLRKAILTLLRVAFGVGILAYLFKSGHIDFRGFGNLAHAWPITIAALICLLIDVLLMAMRTSLLFRCANLYVSLANATRLTLIGFFFSTFLPGAAGGDLAKVYYATKENQGRRAEVAAILVFDRIIGLLSLLLLPLIAAPFFADLIRGVPVLRYLLSADALIVVALISGMGLLMTSEHVRRALSLESKSWMGERNVISRAVSTIAAYRDMPGPLFKALGLSLLANCSLIIVTWLAAVALHPHGISGKLFLVAPLGHVVNSLPLTPGGLGVGETAFAALFDIAGIRYGAETLLCWRVWNAVIGLIGLVIYFFGVGRTVSQAPVIMASEENESNVAASRDTNPVKPSLNA
jgi:glycosyltransferase 2 family protein